MLKLFPTDTVKKEGSTKGWNVLIKTLTTLLWLGAMSPAQGWNKVFEGELTIGNQVHEYGYNQHHHTPYGNLTATRGDTAPVPNNGDLDNIRYLYYDANFVYLGMPDGTADADSLFKSMGIIYNNTVVTFARKDAVHARVYRIGSYVQEWQWPAGHNPAPATIDETITIEFSRPPESFSSNYKATITVGNLGWGETGYETIYGGTARGSIQVSDADPDPAERNAQNFDANDHVGEVKAILRDGSAINLYIDKGTAPAIKNSDRVFTVMRLTQDVSAAQDGSDIRYWDFKRTDATFSTRWSSTAFNWNHDIEAIPGIGKVFTLELGDNTQALACRWRPIWSDCLGTGGVCPLPRQSSVLLGRNEQCMGWEELSQDPRCLTTAPPVNPAVSPRSCAQCQMFSADRGKNIGCFHRPEHNDDQLGVLTSS